MFRLFRRRWLRLLAWTVISLITLLLLGAQYWNWRGARRWKQMQETIAREGESLDLHRITPEAIPDDQNFCALPLLKDQPLAPADKDDTSELGKRRQKILALAIPSNSKVGAPPTPSIASGVETGKAFDLNAWAEWLRKDGTLPMPKEPGDPAKDILAALVVQDDVVKELTAGLSRPDAQWTPAWINRTLPGNLFELPIPHLSPAQALGKGMYFRSIVAAGAGDAVKAHEALMIAMRLTQAGFREPFLIGLLVVCVNTQLTAGATWELCRTHQGTADQFRALQNTFAQCDFRKATLMAMRSELAAAVGAIDEIIRTSDVRILMATNGPEETSSSSSWWNSVLFRLIPTGFFRDNQATIADWNLRYMVRPVRDEGLLGALAQGRQMEKLLKEHQKRRLSHPDEIFALLALPATATVSARVVYSQCINDQAIAACALERYRIEHGAYPDHLEDANHPGEKPIPPDLISGKPMGYRKTPDGRYVLWSVGFDQKDDGGKRNLNPEAKQKKKSDLSYLGDWVWGYQASNQ
jgi:hypothetical protein